MSTSRQLRLSIVATIAFAIANAPAQAQEQPPAQVAPAQVAPAQAAAQDVTCVDGSRAATFAQCPKVRTVLVINQNGSVTSMLMTNDMIKMWSALPGFTLIVGNEFTGLAAPGTTRVALGGETGAAAAGGPARWHAWLGYSQANVGSSFQPLQFSAKASSTLGGIDYTFNDSLLAGVALSDEQVRADTAFNGGKVNANGNTIAPYLSWRINRNWAFNSSAAFGNTNITTTDNSGAGTVTGANKDKRTALTATIGYAQVNGNWRLGAKGSLMSLEDKFSSFTLSNGTFVDAAKTRTTQARLDGEAMYNAGSFIPYVGATYIYDLERPFQNAVGGQAAANDRDGWLVRAGVNFRSSGALYGGVQIASEIGRAQRKNEQILFNVGLRF